MIQCIFLLTKTKQPKVRANRRLRQLLEAYSLDMILSKTNIKLKFSVKLKSISRLWHITYPSMTSTATTVSIFQLLTMVIWVILTKLLEKVSNVKSIALREGTKKSLLLTMSMFTKQLCQSISKMNQRRKQRSNIRRNLRAKRMMKLQTGQLSRSRHMLHQKLIRCSTQLLMSIPCIRLTNRTLTFGTLKRKVLRSTIVSKSTTNKKRAHIHTGRRICMQGLRTHSIT